MTTAISSRLSSSTDSLLRFAMRADAVLSGLTGIAMLLFAPRIAEMSGTTARFEYATGAFFVVFSTAVLVLASRPAIRTSGLALAVGNLLFSVATVVLVLADVFPLTTTGVVLILGTGVYTLVMAELQYQGVRRMGRPVQ
ncbi:hypothetical protein MJO55_21080 [Mycolicibacterium rufum]|uniref:Integral membrane protein n=1 Tax=Mycolicibacterium rufum TaxID=318424 RepID=A0A9X3BJT1_9MYCO|nr:hypothetical protein [Mycolicibacterium rufum]KGI69510.1 membrane protein [Mycolicibacterium rufum]MCV7073688.1 hypothetical protein [Mycolicibacterium rufum]ULP35723.1 hypothetical protein MJO55_21080 [Mycolicibacterium rufum]